MLNFLWEFRQAEWGNVTGHPNTIKQNAVLNQGPEPIPFASCDMAVLCQGLTSVQGDSVRIVEESLPDVPEDLPVLQVLGQRRLDLRRHERNLELGEQHFAAAAALDDVHVVIFLLIVLLIGVGN